MYAGLDTLPPGTPLLINAQTGDGGTCFTINLTVHCGFGWDVGDGWRLLRDLPTSDANVQQAIGALWLVLLTLPLGWLAGFRLGAVLLLVLGWYGWVRVVVDTGLQSISWYDAGALALGIAIGAAVFQSQRRSGQQSTDDAEAAPPNGREVT